MRKRFALTALAALLAAVLFLSGIGFAEQRKQPITSLDKLAQPGVRIAVGIDTPAERSLRNDYPQAEILIYNDIFLAYLDVAKGRIDACVAARREMEFAMQNGLTGVRLLEENYDNNRIAIGISPVTPIPDLKKKLDTFIAERKADGTLDEMFERWALQGEEKMPEIPAAENPTFRLRVGTTGTVMPYSYYSGTTLVGYDIELAYRFAAWLGAEPELLTYDFGGIIAAAEGGRVDCIMSNLFYSEEKEEAIQFSDILFEVPITAMVKDDSNQSLLSGIGASFEKTFLKEDRWRLFLDGIVTTLVMTVLSVLFGTLLGFLGFMACRRGNRAATAISRFCTWLVDGMPTVVLLMVLYYIVFSAAHLSGVAVAVIGFTLIFGSAVFKLIGVGVGAVESGQYEGAWALGCSDRRTFFRIVLPQALPHVMPAYQQRIVTLIKATAVVGYIAVQDLTKMGDIVRSRTYEALFPLIAVTVIYFLIEGLFAFLVGRISINMDPKRRRPKRILRGIQVQESLGGESGNDS